jgi:hypothetical protein
MPFLLAAVLLMMVGDALIELRKPASPTDRWALLAVLLFLPVAFLVARHPGSPSRPGLSWSDRWRASSFWHRLAWLYFPMFAVLEVVFALALGPEGAEVAAVVIIPSGLVTIGVLELSTRLGR